MKKALLTLALLVLLNVPAFAEISLSTVAAGATTNRGQVKGITTTGVSTTVVDDMGVIDASQLTPDALAPAIYIVATTDTGNTPPTGSVTTQTGTNASKTGAIKIKFTGANGLPQIGWLRVYADGN